MKLAYLAAACAAALAVPATAEELKKLPTQLDPAKAYVLVELGTLNETKMPGELVLARYDDASDDVLGHGRSEVPIPEKALRDMRESARKGLVKDKERHTRLHLLELEPDLYVVEAANGTSFSLGSRTFRAESGSVTDLGVLDVTTDWDEGEGPLKIGAGDVLKMALLGPFGMPKQEPRATFVTARVREAGDIALPPLLAAQARPVVWESEGATFGNHLGGLVNRFGGRAERKSRTAPTQAEPILAAVEAADVPPMEAPLAPMPSAE